MKNYIIFTLSMFLIVSSCKVKQSIKDVVIIDDNNPSSSISFDTISIDQTINGISEDTINEDVIEGDGILNLKDIYNIAIILPVFSDSLNMNFETSVESDLEDFEIPLKSVRSLSFIEGMLLALEENNDNDVNLNIKIYDNEASEFKTKSIINKLRNEDIDFIVGPLLSKNIRLVTEFAKEKEIMVFSPFSHLTKASNDYSGYTMLNPSLDSHLKTMATYIVDSLRNVHIKILYPNTVRGEAYSSIMQNLINDINSSREFSDKISYALVEIAAKTNDRRNFKIENHLDENFLNAVIILPASTGFTHNMLTKLNDKRNKFDIIVFGMPNWKNSKTLRLDYFNNLNVHYTDVKWIDKNNEKVISFKKKYKEKYKGYPRDEAYEAYDLFNYLPILINKFGLSLSENIQGKKYKGVFGNYHFKDIYKKTSSFQNLEYSKIPIRIENSDLHIIYYEKYKLHLKK